ncbi:MAG TPA: 3-isopropylmalate dehydrogenase [Alphaproteobacteria bacterium]|nr:3-isopropylmalate dehydrogenase [Alphaproteobacteria bacterium]
MPANKSLLILPGDGIGPEVMRQVNRVIEWFDRRRAVRFEVTEGLIGGASYDAHGTPLTEETIEQAMAADAVLLGAVGGPKWDTLDFAKRPERGLLGLRKAMELFANLRPAIVFEALADASTLKPELVAGLDLVIVRELTGGIYFGEPRGVEPLANGERKGVNTEVYTTSEIRRVARVAFELARQRRKRLCSIDKANVLESSVLWRDEVQRLHDTEFKDVELSHMYVDNAAMQLVRNPKQFDVIVTTNMFGDILSDEASMLTGSLGMLPSASLGAADGSGRRRALYEPVHGSAPDIAGRDIANPLAAILSFAMLLRYSFGMTEDADLIERAVRRVLDGGLRTADIMQGGKGRVSTTVMGDSIIRELDKQAA